MAKIFIVSDVTLNFTQCWGHGRGQHLLLDVVARVVDSNDPGILPHVKMLQVTLLDGTLLQTVPAEMRETLESEALEMWEQIQEHNRRAALMEQIHGPIRLQ